MYRRIRLLLGLLTGIAMVGWTYLVMRLNVAGAWGANPNNTVRLTLCALPYAILVFNLLTCAKPNRILCGIGLLVNFPFFVLAVAWISQPGGIPAGSLLLLYLLCWYGYGANVLRGPQRSETMAPFKA